MRFIILFLLLGLVMPIGVCAQSTTARDLKNKFSSASSNMKQNKDKTKDKKQSLSNHVRPENIESIEVRKAFDEIESGQYDYDALYAQLEEDARSDADAAFGLGIILILASEEEADEEAVEGLITEAIKFLQIATELDPASSEAFYVLGLAYAEQGNYDKAEDAFIASLEKDPTDPDVWYELGFLYYDAGLTEDADLCLAVIQEIDPNYPFKSYED